MANAVLGICACCGKTRDCLEANIGWVCRECFRRHLQMEGADGIRIGVAPPAGMRAWFIVDGVGANCFITIHGQLHAYRRVEDAQWTLQAMGSAGIDTRRMRIEEREALEAFLYSWMAGLGMDVVEGLRE